MANAKFIKSPKTGRDILVDGPAYEALLKSRTYGPKAKNAKRFTKKRPSKRISNTRSPRSVSLPRAKVASAKKTLNSLPKSRKSVRKSAENVMKRKGEGRGSATRGWGAAAPQRGRERNALMRKCGRECFLDPATESFPICAALRTGQGCSVDPRGLAAAKVRAGQWKYRKVAKRASQLQKRY